MKKLLSRAAVVGCVALGGALASASAAGAVTFGSSWDGPGKSLQEQLDAITVGGPKIDTVNAQTGFQTFTNTASGGSVATFMFEIAGDASTNKFGIYNSAGQKAQLFGGPNDTSDQSFVSFNDGDVSVITKAFTPGYTGALTTNDYEDFGNIFGFYLEKADGTTFYSESARNTDGLQQAVIYQGNNATKLKIPGKSAGTFTDDEIIVAFEDLLRVGGNSDSDFQDLVVLVESVESVPEPGTTSALVAFGLLGIGSIWKRQRQKNA